MMWLEGRLHSDVPINNMVTQLDLRQAINVEAFKQAFGALVNYHDAMRFVVSFDGENFVGEATNDMPAELEFMDLSSHTDPDERLGAWIQQKCLRVFLP